MYASWSIRILLDQGEEERAQRIKSGSRQRCGSLTSPYPANPYSVLSETSELLAGRASRQHSYLRSSSRRRNLSHSQQLHRSITAHDGTLHNGHASADVPHSHSRSRSRHPYRQVPSRSSSTDTIPAVAAAAAANNYRALSDAAMSVVSWHKKLQGGAKLCFTSYRQCGRWGVKETTFLERIAASREPLQDRQITLCRLRDRDRGSIVAS